MKKVWILAAVLGVSACGKPAQTESTTESVAALIAHPERLRELRAQCKADHAKVGDAQCNAVAEATRQRFMGGGTPYTPPASPPAAFSAPEVSASEACVAPPVLPSPSPSPKD